MPKNKFMTIGIDLGTTNTCAAYHDGRASHIIEMPDGQRMLPSVVAVHPDTGRVLVGRSAINASLDNPTYTFRHTKRIIGRQYHEQEHGFFQYTRGPSGEVWLVGPQRVYSPAEIASHIIKYVLDATEAKYGERPTGAVITVPAAFNERQRAATREAAVTAGLPIGGVTIMEEPSAAALAYGIDKEKMATAAVYDLGGGTFDIAIMRCGRTRNRTIGLDGDSDLGGVDFDKRLSGLLIDRWNEQHTDDLGAREHCVIRIEEAAEKAKIELTSLEETTVYLDHLVASESGGILAMREGVTRAELEAATADLVGDTLKIVDQAIGRAKITTRDLDHLIMVGGMTRMPAVREAVSQHLGLAAMKGIVPEETVATGAATRAAMIDQRIGGSTFASVTPISTGIEAANGVMTVAIPKGSAMPFEKLLIVTTERDQQEVCSIHIVQGEETSAKANGLIMTEHVPVEPGPAGEAGIAVLFRYSQGGALSVSVDGKIIHGAESDA